MQARLPILRYFCSSILNNHAFKGLKDTAAREQLTSGIAANAQNKQKLDALSNVILSLSHAQVQYLIGLQNEAALAGGNKISDNMVFSLGDDKKSALEYLYQKRWIQDHWKDYNILNSLFSDQGDKQNLEAAEVVKEIYEFQLTSVDPAQKIKVIKVIRELLGLGLKQAKDIVDKAPVVMKKGKKQQGQQLKAELAKNGCVVTLK